MDWRIGQKWHLFLLPQVGLGRVRDKKGWTSILLQSIRKHIKATLGQVGNIVGRMLFMTGLQSSIGKAENEVDFM